jgi:UDP-N-acetylglucosamine 2-epimerase (non-hydrolysing)
MKIMTVVGARPNFMKVAPIIAAIRAHNSGRLAQAAAACASGRSQIIRHVLVHTGQHYDQLMSDSFFADLDLPKPDVYLGIGSGSHAVQTAEIMRKFEDVLLQAMPDVLVLVGDVNSTLACALVAAKVASVGAGTRPLIAHVEAGLRSFDRTMPEEINRIVTDQLSDLLFVTEASGLVNLAREGVPDAKVHFVGNTMIDTLLAYREKAESSAILDELGLRNAVDSNGSGHSITPYALLTLHRPANVDQRDSFLMILEGIQELTRTCRVIFPAHPRTAKRITELGLGRYFDLPSSQQGESRPSTNSTHGAIRMIEPLGYLDFMCLMQNSELVVTDSGGIQEETTCLGIPCVTVRDNTERPITTEVGTNILAGVKTDGIRAAIRQQLKSAGRGAVPPKWDGDAAKRIVDILLSSAPAVGWKPENARCDDPAESLVAHAS